MKRRVFVLALCFALIFSFTVSAQTVKNKANAVSLEIPDGYTVLTEDNLRRNDEFLEKLGHTVDSFRKKMEEGGILIYAATSDNRRQIQLKTWTSDFSETAQDLTRLDDEALTQARETLLEQMNQPGQAITNVAQVTTKDLIFFRITALVSGGEKDFCFRQYLTVANGRYYALVYYNDEAELSAAQQEEAESVFSTLSIEKKKSGGLIAGNTVVQIVLITAVLAAAVFLTVLIVLSFIRDIRNRRRELEPLPEHIKMRRKK